MSSQPEEPKKYDIISDSLSFDYRAPLQYIMGWLDNLDQTIVELLKRVSDVEGSTKGAVQRCEELASQTYETSYAAESLLKDSKQLLHTSTEQTTKLELRIYDKIREIESQGPADKLRLEIITKLAQMETALTKTADSIDARVAKLETDIKKPAKEPSKEPSKEPAKEPAKEEVKEPAKEPATEPAKEDEVKEEVKEPAVAKRKDTAHSKTAAKKPKK